MAKMRMHTDRLRKGMVISNDVYSNGGLLLVNAGTPVTKDVAALLARHFIEYVIVEFKESGAAKPETASMEEVGQVKMTEQQKAEFKESIKVAENALSSSFKAIVYQNGDINVSGMLNMLNGILEKATNDVSLCDMLFSMKESKESLYRHSINVSLIGQMLAKWLKFSQEEIELVSITGLLHDIGLVGLQKENTNMDYLFFREVWENKKRQYEKHVFDGYNIIKNKKIDPRIIQAVLTHHERIDQSGFPMQVPAANINKISRVIAVADAYDILTMQKDENELVSPLNVLNYLQDLSYTMLDPSILITFIEKITISYIQKKVLLSNGKTGTIILLNKFNLPRPLVRSESVLIDLAERPDIQIVKFIE